MATEKGQQGAAPKSRADMPQGPRSTGGQQQPAGRQPSSIAAGRAERNPPPAGRQQQQQQPGRQQQQPADDLGDEQGEGREFDQGDEQGEGHQGGSTAVARRGGQHDSADLHAGVFDNVKLMLLRQTLTWHAESVGKMLGIDNADIVAVLGEVAEEFANG